MQATIPEFVGMAVMGAVVLKMLMNAGGQSTGESGQGPARGLAWFVVCLLICGVTFYLLFKSTFR